MRESKKSKVLEMVRVRTLKEIGMRVGPGEPVFDRKGRKWHVPLFCAPDPRDPPETDPVAVGVAVLDNHLNMIVFPTRAEVSAVLEEAYRGKYNEPLGEWIMRQVREDM
jgi:hypothetical protein